MPPAGNSSSSRAGTVWGEKSSVSASSRERDSPDSRSHREPVYTLPTKLFR